MAKTRTTDNQTAAPADQRGSGEALRDAVNELPDERGRIARRAYELYLERGGSHGQDWDDWLAAEREVRATRMNRNE
jgi:hypothetical protein